MAEVWPGKMIAMVSDLKSEKRKEHTKMIKAFNYDNVYMNAKYEKKKSKDSLVNIISTKGTYHTAHPKESVVDLFQTGIIQAIREYGVNIQVALTDVYEMIGDQSSSFHDNFCGGVNGIISYGEKEVLNRFAEAVEKAGDSLDDKLRSGLRSFCIADSHSKYNAYDGQSFNMKVRTQFVVELCRPKYWQIVIKPLLPAINDYVTEVYPKWALMPEIEKSFVHRMFADVLREIAGEIVEKDLYKLPRLEQAEYLRLYVTVFKKQILGIAWAMFDDKDKNRTSFGGHVGSMMT